MEERYVIGVDIGEGSDWCDKRTMNDPIEVLRVLGANMAKQLNLSDMEEKKTKKMTRAEAFEHLKGTKVFCKDYDKMKAVQDFLRSLGFWWSDASKEMVLTHTIFLHKDGRLSFALSLQYFREHESPELSADDILSIEIVVEEKYELEFNYDKVVELAKPLMHYLNEVGCPDGIRVSQLGIVHEPMSTLIFDNGIGRIE